MNIADIKLMYEYNYWANKRILDTAENLSSEQLLLPTGFPWGSLRGTLVHTMDTEYGWRVLVQHQTSTPVMKLEDFPTLAAIRARWDEEEQELWAYLNSLTDADMQGIVSYVAEVETGTITRNRVLWHCLYHVVNHGMQHRSECAAMLTNFGHSPGDLDFTQFPKLPA
jgi:uncharacterized damage-inducible protein DinB